MDDYDYANEEFFNMWKQRTQKKDQGKSQETEGESGMSFDG